MEELNLLLKECCPMVDFSKEKNLITNKTIDSMDIVNIISALEEKFNISIEFEMITPDNFDSVESIEAMVKRLQEG